MEEKIKENKKTFISGALILGLAGLVIKLLGAVFRIPLANIIGDDGMGYYQTAYPVYNLFLTIATAGIPTAISRMVAERRALGRNKDAHKVFKVSFLLLFATGLVSFSVLFFGAGVITNIIEEPDASYCMKAIAPALLFCPIMGAFRGYFQGRQNMKPTAVSQIVEQLFRVAIGLSLAIVLLPKGNAIAAAGASFGASAGGFFGCIGIGLLYLVMKKKAGSEFIPSEIPGDGSEKSGKILRDILVIAIPITLGSAVLPIINTIDTAIVKSRLISIGYSSDVARSLYGQLTGMASPLINFPQVILQAVSVSLVPVIASAYKKGNTEFMHKNIALSFRYAMIISAPCAVGMSVLAEPIMLLFYPLQKEAAVSAAACLSILAYGVIFLGLTHTFTGTLQGIGKQIIPVINLCVGAVCKIIVTYTLTGIESLNVRGAAIGTITAYFVAAVLNLIFVKKYTKVKLNYVKSLLKPCACAAFMGVVVHFAYKLLSGSLGNAISCAVSVVLGVLIYVVSALLIGVVTMQELCEMPKIGRFFKKFAARGKKAC